MNTRSLFALLACSLLAVACEDAVARPPSAPVPSQTYFMAQQAALPPGGAYQPGWTGQGTGSTVIQAPPASASASASPSAAPASQGLQATPGGGGGGSVSTAQAVVAAMASGFRRCYNTGLREESREMKGTVRVTAKIDAMGRVASATPSGEEGLSEKVVGCVVAVVANGQFAAPEGGGATVVIPVTFIAVDPPKAPAAAPTGVP